METLTFLCAIGIPSGVIGFGFWKLQRRLEKKEQKDDAREAARRKNEYLVVKSINASIALGEATAHAMQRGYANGDMEKALEYARGVKHEMKDFLTQLGVDSLY